MTTTLSFGAAVANLSDVVPSSRIGTGTDAVLVLANALARVAAASMGAAKISPARGAKQKTAALTEIAWAAKSLNNLDMEFSRALPLSAGGWFERRLFRPCFGFDGLWLQLFRGHLSRAKPATRARARCRSSTRATRV